jgi:hypothetical protein
MQAKKGQVEMSFGMIFSIILIIAVIGIGFYVIRYFMSLSTCTSTGLFYTSLEKEVNQAWGASASKSIFFGTVPGTVKYVCFGNLSAPIVAGNSDKQQALINKYPFSNKENVFLYPTGSSSCQPDFGSRIVDHVISPKFFCVQAIDNKIKVAITKGSTDSVVSITAT